MFGGRYAGEENLRHGILGDAVADGVLGGEPGDEPPDGDGEDGEEARKKWKRAVKGMSTTQWLARKHGVTGRRKMYVLSMIHSRIDEYEEQIMDKSEAEGLRQVVGGYVLTGVFPQVSSILFPLLELDNAIPLVLSTRRSHRRLDYGLFLHPHVPLIRLEPWPHSTHQRAIFVRLQSIDLRLARQLSADGCWA